MHVHEKNQIFLGLQFIQNGKIQCIHITKFSMNCHCGRYKHKIPKTIIQIGNLNLKLPSQQHTPSLLKLDFRELNFLHKVSQFIPLSIIVLVIIEFLIKNFSLFPNLLHNTNLSYLAL